MTELTETELTETKQIELEIIQSQIDNLMNKLRNIRTSLYELSEQEKIVTNQIVILENTKKQINQANQINQMVKNKDKEI